jgi:hypothetical protein
MGTKVVGDLIGLAMRGETLFFITVFSCSCVKSKLLKRRIF